MESVGSCVLRPAERLSRTPDTMQDNGELSGQRHPCFAITRSLDPYTGVIPRMPADQNGDLFWNRGALTPPKSAAGIVNDANNGRLLGNVQSNKAGHRGTSD